MQVRNWLYVEDFARGIGHVLEHGAPGEVYNVGGPRRVPEPRGRQRIIDAHGATDDADRVRHRPARPRPPLLAGLARRSARSAGRPRSASTRAAAHRAWYRDNAAWWEPIRSGDYRAYYERQYGTSLG
jgi:dTDP-glucose 4,6-dehydratase